MNGRDTSWVVIAVVWLLMVRRLAHDHVAGEHHPELVLELQAFVRQSGVAGSENPVLRCVGADLGLERRLHVDVREQSEAFGHQAGDDFGDHGVEWARKRSCHVVTHAEKSDRRG